MKYLGLATLLIISIMFSNSCTKNLGTPLAYEIDSFKNIYIRNNDTTYFPVRIKFLAGNSNEEVKVFFTQIPGNVTLSQDTIKGKNNFVANFGFHAINAQINNYPVYLVTYTESAGYRYHPVNLGVVHTNCANYLNGNFTGTNSCQPANYSYPSTVSIVDSTTLNINNVGGYGSNTNAVVRMNCNTDSIFIDRQDIGNGITMTGSGHFNYNQLIIYYKAQNLVGGYNDSCMTVLTMH